MDGCVVSFFGYELIKDIFFVYDSDQRFILMSEDEGIMWYNVLCDFYLDI